VGNGIELEGVARYGRVGGRPDLVQANRGKRRTTTPIAVPGESANRMDPRRWMVTVRVIAKVDAII
jgi:hypothetical protein